MPNTIVGCNFCTNLIIIDESYISKFTYFMCNDCIRIEYGKYIGDDVWKDTDEYKKRFMKYFFITNQNTYCDSIYFRSLYDKIEHNLGEHLFYGLDPISSSKKRKSKKKSKSLKKRKSKKKSRRARV